MYLTRFRINTARAAAPRLLSSPQRLHAAVMAAFAEPPGDTGGARVLWRLDHNAPSQVWLYITSPDRPDLTHLVEQAGWPTTGGWQSYDYAPFLDKLTTGDTWAFRLTANPVHSIRRKEGEPTKRTAHLTPRHQRDWLLRQGENAGFRIAETPDNPHPDGKHQLLVHRQRRLTFGKHGQPAGKPVTLTTVTYDGRLHITDADTFRRTLVRGLGKAKAYGCGLMTLAPVR